MPSLALFTALTVLGAGSAVPSFTRQTGLSCNQCHVTYGAPVPNFTFTGKKFRIDGYRMPYVSQKIEAGEEGALTGNRLALSLWPYVSFRFQSTFASRSRAPGAADWGRITSNPTSRFSFFPGGAFAENFAVWSELYLTPDGSTTEEWSQGVFSFDEYDFRFTTGHGWGTFGIGFTNQSAREVGGFGPWPVAVTDYFNGGTWRGWGHPNRGTLVLHAFVNDRVFATVGAGPGDNDLQWGRGSYQAQLAFAPWNTDARELWVVSTLQFGQDGIPLVTGYVPSRDGNLTWDYVESVGGVAATRPAPNTGQPYLSTDMQSFVRSTSELRYGFSNRGPHSMEANLRLSLNHETYRDGAEATNNAVSAALRYAWEHTIGLDVVIDKSLHFHFQDAGGTDNDVDPGMTYSLYLSFRPAMNLLIYLNYANAEQLNIASTARVSPGRSWSLAMDLLF